MRKILYILVATMVASLFASCKSKAVVTHTEYDTITIERAIVQEVDPDKGQHSDTFMGDFG